MDPTRPAVDTDLTYPRAMTFDPDWVVHPGAILMDWLNEHNDGDVPADTHGIDADTMSGVLNGTSALTDELADRIGAMTRTNPQLWVNLERNFRQGLVRGKAWSDRPSE